MGCQYYVDGKMTLKNYRDMNVDLEYLEEDLGEIELTKEVKDDVTVVSISGDYYMSYGTAVEIDRKLRAFGKHVVEPACFATECDNEHGEVWVGEKEAVDKAIRAKLMDYAVDLMKQLTPDERQTVITTVGEEDTSEEPASTSA